VMRKDLPVSGQTDRPTTRQRGAATTLAAMMLGASASLTLAGGAEGPGTDARGASEIIGVRVVIENLAPENGTWLTPTWIGFHDGGFDTFDVGTAADESVERLAEDGNAGPLQDRHEIASNGVNQGVLAGDLGNPQLAPGETATRTFVLDPTDARNHFLSYASMVIPSNDAFIGNDIADQHRILTTGGSFLGALITVDGTAVLDAGTEVNDEVPEHTAFFGQTEPDSGEEEGGTIAAHPGFLPPGSGGILDDPMFADADFLADGYRTARITVIRNDTIVPGGLVSGMWTRDGSPYLVEGDVTVPAGQTLEIEPGVVVFTRNEGAVRVEGTLLARGTEEEPILFTGSDATGDWLGIRFENTTTTSILEHCTIENGDQGTTTYDSGGAIALVNGSLELRSCVIRDNEAFVFGGGIHALDADLLVEDSIFEGNLMDGSGSAEGGAIYAEDSIVAIRRSVFRDNRVVPFISGGTTNARGGAIALRNTSGVIEKCLFARNRISHGASGNGDSEGAAIYVKGGSPELVGNTIARNLVFGNHQRGGGIYLESSALVSTNIIADNDDVGIFVEAGAPLIEYNDISGNDDGAVDGPSAPGEVGIIVMENLNGDPCDAFFNIFLDPAFVAPLAGDFHLQPTSPAIDAGDPDRPDDPDGTIADIGAFAYDQATVAVGDAASAGEPRFLIGASPEPLRRATTIRYRLNTAREVTLTVHDVTGRRVRTLLHETVPAGEHTVRFDATDAAGDRLRSGVYFYRLSTGVTAESGRLTVVR